MDVSFVKYHGLGNDFLVVDGRDVTLDPRRAEQLCDRRRGVGGDGVLVYEPSLSAQARMIIYNADGSRPQMCGNGLRCFVRWLIEADLAGLGAWDVETDAGLRRIGAEVYPREAGEAGAVEVSVDMGPARFEPDAVPMRPGDEALEVDGERLRVRGVSMGNPHAVVRVDGWWSGSTMAAARRFGERLSRHPRFPEQANAGFARLSEAGHVELTVWERGCGITQACGTGAAAAVAALTREEPRLAGQDVPVDLPGGRLVIRAPGAGEPGGVMMRGPAVRVFEGVATIG